MKISKLNSISVFKMHGFMAKVWGGGVLFIFNKTSGTTKKDQILPALLRFSIVSCCGLGL